MQKWHKYLFLITLLLVVSYSYGQGCSQCKLLAEQGSELDEASFGENINYGILYLMAAPYVLLLIFFRKKIVGVYKALTEKM